jgi:hypothetical protein
MLVGATTTYLAFRPDPVRAMDAGDLKALQQGSTVYITVAQGPGPCAEA